MALFHSYDTAMLPYGIKPAWFSRPFCNSDLSSWVERPFCGFPLKGEVWDLEQLRKVTQNKSENPETELSIWRSPEMRVPQNHDLNEISLLNHPFGGTPILGNPHVGCFPLTSMMEANLLVQFCWILHVGSVIPNRLPCFAASFTTLFQH